MGLPFLLPNSENQNKPSINRVATSRLIGDDKNRGRQIEFGLKSTVLSLGRL